MNMHVGFVLNTLFCGALFLGGRHWAKLQQPPYPPRAGGTGIQRQLELWRFNHTGKLLSIIAAAAWLVSAAAYLAILLNIISE